MAPPDPLTLSGPPPATVVQVREAAPERPARRAWEPASKVALIVALVGSGGLGALVQPAIAWALSGAERQQRVDALTVQVSELTSAVNRLAEEQKKTGEAVANIQGRLEPIANLRGTISEADSHLSRKPRPDVAAARQVLAGGE